VDADGGVIGVGLPCDVKAMLVKECVSCHGSPPTQGAPISLTSYADLTAASKTHPGKTVADVSLLRMKDTSSPMPPGQTPSASDVATLDKWIKAGTPKGTCGGAVTDAGGGPNPYNTPAQCTSNKFWTGGDNKSASMHPGGACVTCHKLGGKASGKSFDIAGTVYPTAHEPDECNGVGGVTVVITDANNQDHVLTVNAVGNFYHQDFFGFQKFPTPYRAKVVAGGKTRAMSAAQTDGNCNACHTQNGAQNAPGRIMTP
jgi:mono/diheme cytochrome c family protein